jgi:SAM-dependent methyltransferase
MSVPDSIRSAQAYWDTAAEAYQDDFAGTLIGQTLRQAVWRDLDVLFRPGQRVLELNCGTGIDAVHMAQRGIRVLACDIAPRMIELANAHAGVMNTGDLIDLRVMPTEHIDALKGEGPFDGVFSNFSGLNCVDDLPAVAQNLERLVRPGAPVLLCMIGRFVPWEILWFLMHGKPRRALLRLRGNRACRPETGTVKVQYPSVREIARLFAPEFELRGWKGIGIAVPPSYLEGWARRFPRVINSLARVDRSIARLPFLRSMADFVLLEFERRETKGGA